MAFFPFSLFPLIFLPFSLLVSSLYSSFLQLSYFSHSSIHRCRLFLCFVFSFQSFFSFIQSFIDTSFTSFFSPFVSSLHFSCSVYSLVILSFLQPLRPFFSPSTYYIFPLSFTFSTSFFFLRSHFLCFMPPHFFISPVPRALPSLHSSFINYNSSHFLCHFLLHLPPPPSVPLSIYVFPLPLSVFILTTYYCSAISKVSSTKHIGEKEEKKRENKRVSQPGESAAG